MFVASVSRELPCCLIRHDVVACMWEDICFGSLNMDWKVRLRVPVKSVD